MDRLRYFALALALVLPTIAIRLGGTTLWVVYGAGLVVFPVVLAYTIGVYAIFRGKLHDGYE